MKKQQATSKPRQQEQEARQAFKECKQQQGEQELQETLRKSRAMTKNFSLAELTKTSTGLPNALPNHLEGNLRALAENVLQPARDALGADTGNKCVPQP
jgi:hypothetical protein